MSDSLPNSPDNSLGRINASSESSKKHPQKNNLMQISDIDNIWLLPDGVSDLLSEQAQKQEWLRHTLTQLLVRRGYELISPPMIEFTESLLSNASEDLKRQTFKIIDQLSGRLMGVRADITPQISRIDAHLNKLGAAPAISRYCYAGHVIRTLPHGLFGSRTPLQLGAEIFGCQSLAADLELIDVLYDLLDTLNLKDELHIDIGHVAIYERLKQLSGLSEDDSVLLMALYANKALPDLREKSTQMPMGEDFYQLAVFGHDMSALKAALSTVATEDHEMMQAILEVEQMVAHIKQKHQGKVSIDITELGYHYHTGIVFNGYFASGSQAVVRGGRFNARNERQSAQTSSSASGSQQGQFSNTSSNANASSDANASIESSASAIKGRSATGFSLELTRLQQYIDQPQAPLILVDYASLQRIGMTHADVTNKTVTTNSSTDTHSSIETTSNSEQLRAKLTAKVEALRLEDKRVILPLSANDIPKGVSHHLTLDENDWVLSDKT